MILQALKGFYDRAPDGIAAAGFSEQKISFEVVLREDGAIVDIGDLRVVQGRKLLPRPMLVPQPPKRSGRNPPPAFLWDKTGYVFGVESSEADKTVAVENTDYRAAFVAYHEKLLAGADDAGLLAVSAFLRDWSPARYEELRHAAEMLDTSVVFRLDGARQFIHERPAARDVWARSLRSDQPDSGLCLVTGEIAPVARLHASIKGVAGAQSSGASIVSFNLDAFESYGKKQGANAPVSVAATFAYTTALNHLLSRTSGRDAKDRPIYRNRVQIADATTVFWAEAAERAQAEASEDLVAALFNPPDDGPADDDASATAKLGDVVKAIATGRPLADAGPGLAADTKFYLLGLSPNAARISVRFWHATTLGELGAAFQQHWQDMRIEQPPARAKPPSVSACTLMTAPARKDRQGRIKFAFDDVSPLLGGELTRSILTQARYPASLLANLVMRVRTDGALTGLRVALIKACIVRSMRLDRRLPKEDYLVRSDPDDPNPARRLGRMFALIERAQLAALGDGINATVKDKFIGAAAATPAQVFNGLVKNSFHHTGRLRRGHSEAKWVKNPKPVGIAIERDIGRLWATFESGLPKQHTTEEQGLFFVGYFQERYGGRADPNVGPEPGVDSTDDSDDNDQE